MMKSPGGESEAERKRRQTRSGTPKYLIYRTITSPLEETQPKSSICAAVGCDARANVHAACLPPPTRYPSPSKRAPSRKAKGVSPDETGPLAAGGPMRSGKAARGPCSPRCNIIDGVTERVAYTDTTGPYEWFALRNGDSTAGFCSSRVGASAPVGDKPGNAA